MTKSIKIVLENIEGMFFLELESEENRIYNLYDENQEYICGFYAPIQEKVNQIVSEIKSINNISELVDLGLVQNMIWGSNNQELYKVFLDYFSYDEEEYTYQEFMKNIPINAISVNPLTNNGNTIYFIVDLQDF